MKKLYGLPALVTALAAFVAFVYVRFSVYSGEQAFIWRVPLDLSIYVLAGQDVAAGGFLYDSAYIGDLPFTYPPFAGAMFALLASFSDAALIVCFHLATAAALLAIVVMVFRERGVRLTPLTWAAIVLLVLAMPANESIHGTLFFGQINIALMLLVALDILPRNRRLPGIGIGLAAGLKLTPAYLGLVLIFQRRWWAVYLCIMSFLVTVAIGFVFIPDAGVFWSDSMFNSSRVGAHSNTGAKSLRSLMYRVLDIDGGLPWVLALVAVFVLTCLALRTAYRRDNRTMALALTGMSACLVSPFSWYHHFVWTIPFGLAVLIEVNRRVGARLTGPWGPTWAGLAGLGAMLVVELPYVSAPVWHALSSSNLDAIDAFQPWATSWWPLATCAYIAAYAVLGFLPARASAAERAADQRAEATATADTDPTLQPVPAAPVLAPRFGSAPAPSPAAAKAQPTPAATPAQRTNLPKPAPVAPVKLGPEASPAKAARQAHATRKAKREELQQQGQPSTPAAKAALAKALRGRAAAIQGRGTSPASGRG